MKIEKPSESAAELRRQAEAQLKEPYIQGKQLPSVAEALRLVHELQVHQVELELQNKALVEARNQLEQSVEKYANLYDFAPVGYFSLAANGNIQELNLAGAALLGVERARLIDRRFALFISAESRPAFNAFLDAALTGIALARCEIILAPENAPRRHLHLEGIGAMRGSARYCRLSALDITERKQAESDLRRREEQYRAVIETSPDGFWITNMQGRLLEVNDAYARLSGYRCDELLNMTIADLEASETPIETAARIHKIARDGSDLFQTFHRAKNGQVWAAEINAAYWPIDSGRLFIFIRDVNHRQRSEALLKVRMRLSAMAIAGSLDDVIKAALDEAEHFTGSEASFSILCPPIRKI
ncbi:MAG: PAS domain S-box protein [Synechococcaceae cyanobacterium SM1_2_3]|nr:PAS domain S-box protein [Synechococcaceae cyanobacterium SM1_2_3]